MEPQNNQNNNSDSIKIQPTVGGGTSPVQSSPMHTFADDMRNAKAQGGTPNNTEIKPEQKTGIGAGDKVLMHSMRTYADDIKNTIQTDGISMAKIAMAEAKKQQIENENEEELSPTSPKNKNIILISVIAVLLAVLVLFAVWYFVGAGKWGSSAKITSKQNIVSIIPYDEISAITLEKKDRMEIIEKIELARSGTFNKEANIVFLPIFENIGTSTAKIKAEEFLYALETRASAALKRSFSGEFMFGFHKYEIYTNPFILLSTGSLSQSYAGMLEWEPAMADDIGTLFFNKEDLIDVVDQGKIQNLNEATSYSLNKVSTTSTSTNIAEATDIEEIESRPKYILANSLKFSDEILNNRDLRVLRTPSGKVLLYYTFISDRLLLIARDFKTLDEVVKRLATTQFKQ